jgi:hypothetical protein
VAPVLRAPAGLPRQKAGRIEATLPLRIASKQGRTQRQAQDGVADAACRPTVRQTPAA